MTKYYNLTDIAHLPDHYPKFRYRVLGPLASSVMLLASRMTMYTEAERETEWFKKMQEEATNGR